MHELLICEQPNMLKPLPSNHKNRHMILSDPNFKLAYYRTHLWAMEVAKMNYVPVRQSLTGKSVEELGKSFYDTDGSGPDIFFIESLMQNDMAGTNMWFACVAWLSYDEFRWHETENYGHIREDLFYGLVLQYADFILPYAAYLLDLNRSEQWEISSEVAEEIEEKARTSTKLKSKQRN